MGHFSFPASGLSQPLPLTATSYLCCASAARSLSCRSRRPRPPCTKAWPPRRSSLGRGARTVALGSGCRAQRGKPRVGRAVWRGHTSPWCLQKKTLLSVNVERRREFLHHNTLWIRAILLTTAEVQSRSGPIFNKRNGRCSVISRYLVSTCVNCMSNNQTMFVLQVALQFLWLADLI